MDRLLKGDPEIPVLKPSAKSSRIVIDDWTASDLEMIGVGSFSPLEGFMCQADYESVLERKRLVSNLPWTIPITLAVDASTAARSEPGLLVVLMGEDRGPFGSLQVAERFVVDRFREARLVYGTDDPQHPGVARVLGLGEWRLGGAVTVFQRPRAGDYGHYLLDPKDTRRLFQERGWRTVVGFQTRNPVHRAHEYIQKCALEIVDGLLLQPLVGPTKEDDVPTSVRMRCYEVLLQQYYPADRVVLGVLPAAMRYAGPREAIFHAIVRKNYGCTHFIVGRDHAGVGSYYGSFDAHRIFDEFDPAELGITPLFFDHTFYCRTCEGMTSSKTCPHPAGDHVVLSGTQIRTMLRNGDPIPREFSRPEVAAILREWMKEMNG